MPVYVYGCGEKDHPRKEITHKMADRPAIKCDECGKVMHKVPQSMRFYLSPVEILLNWSEENYNRMRARKRGQKAPHFSKDKVNQPGPGLPQRDFDKRRYKR